MQEAPKKITVGDEFIDWAEKYYKLKELYEQEDLKSKENNNESCPYEFVKNTFIYKINELIKNKLSI